MGHVNEICETKTISKGEVLLEEGGESDRVYMIQSGEVSLYKRIQRQSYVERSCFKECKVLDLGVGDLFGEDKLFFKMKNRYTVKISSRKAVVTSITVPDFKQNYKSAIPDLTKQLKVRHNLLESQVQKIRKNYAQKNLSNFD